jgi:hypothetical protein
MSALSHFRGGDRKRKALFISELVLSPLIAGIAILVPLAAHWGAFKYAPAAMWCVVFAHCLYSFRWRGLWFLLGMPIALIAILVFLVAAPPVPIRAVSAAAVGLIRPRIGLTETLTLLGSMN